MDEHPAKAFMRSWPSGQTDLTLHHEALRYLYQAYGKAVNTIQMGIWSEDLQKFSKDQVWDAVRELKRMEEHKYMPSLSNIITYCASRLEPKSVDTQQTLSRQSQDEHARFTALRASYIQMLSKTSDNPEKKLTELVREWRKRTSGNAADVSQYGLQSSIFERCFIFDAAEANKKGMKLWDYVSEINLK